MDSLHSGFLFGATVEATSDDTLLKRIHLATRGAGDWPSLAKALNKCRRNRRYLTEGYTVCVKPDYEKKTDHGEAVSVPVPTIDNSASIFLNNTDSSSGSFGHNEATRSGNRDPSGLKNEIKSQDKGKRPPNLESYTSQQGTPRTVHRHSGENQAQSLEPEPPEPSSTFFSVCSAAFNFTRSLSRMETHERNGCGTEYIIVKCEPQGGYISENTLFYVDERLPELQRVDLLWDVETESHVKRCIDHLLGHAASDTLTKSILLRQERMSGPYYIDNNSDSPPSSGRVRKTIFINHQDQSHATAYSHSKVNNMDTKAAVEALFKAMFNNVLAETLSSDFRVYYSGQNLTIRDLKMFVTATRPASRPGIITPSTEIYVGVDTVGECLSVTVAPLRDTLPTTYEYNLIKDCVEPYFRGRRSRTYHVNDVFRFGGVQFRIVAFEHRDDTPQLFDFDLLNPFWTRGSCGRVGPTSVIYVKDPVELRLTDLLSPDQLRCLRRCAPSQRELLLFKMASQLDSESLERLYSSEDGSRHLLPLDRVDTYHAPSVQRTPSGVDDTVQHYNISDTSIATGTPMSLGFDICTVCYENIGETEPSGRFKFPCGHVFHLNCANEWMNMRGESCPNCRHGQSRLVSSSDIGYTGQFHTLSDAEETVYSEPDGPFGTADTASSSGASELLQWFNSQEL
ncbi:uncharacterized protein BXIN_2121 [Babesia sp. Xinjiang]|uniref:uncharacterized protein n=1 Tax=Babesia sp. Xinjiang TaxID=462227 RepID=UPI000A260329|nr:uncharacterized protein BXIN_2121 [Babesia sp. Xinjiang]ORM40564.1 hypothetical protein BXIN_2121 [Babesia sp. Xinjiang]